MKIYKMVIEMFKAKKKGTQKIFKFDNIAI